MPGSSGSPVFDRQGRLFALHHASKPEAVSSAATDGRQVNVVNEGIKTAAIIVSDLDGGRENESEKCHGRNRS